MAPGKDKYDLQQGHAEGAGKKPEIRRKLYQLLTVDNIMFFSMLLVSVVVGFSVGFYELNRNKHTASLSPICDIGYCYYLDADLLISSQSNAEFSYFKAIYNKLEYLKSIGVELLILNKIDLQSEITGYSSYIRKTLVQARKLGITIYMVIDADTIDIARSYINLGVLGFVSKIFDTFTCQEPNPSDLCLLKKLLRTTRVPINGLLLYWPQTTRQIGNALSQANKFDFTIIPVSQDFTTSRENFIFSTGNEDSLSFRTKLIVVAKVLVQKKCLIYGGYELQTQIVDFYTQDVPIVYSDIAKLMKHFHKFRIKNLLFQKSLRIPFSPLDDKDFTVYKRSYRSSDNSGEVTDFYMFIKSTEQSASLTIKDYVNESTQSLVIVYAFSTPDVGDRLEGTAVNFNTAIQIPQNLILLIVKAQ